MFGTGTGTWKINPDGVISNLLLTNDELIVLPSDSYRG